MLIVVYGNPASQGSKKGFVVKGRAILVEASARTRPWRQDVKGAALEIRNGAAPLDGPIAARMVFTMPKPASAPKRRRTFPMRKPDIDKLCRLVFDSLVDAGVMTDDARVVRLEAWKVFPNEHMDALESPGVRITIEPLDCPA
jgi:Holliday junction resolvase RusA-like endonuclease